MSPRKRRKKAEEKPEPKPKDIKELYHDVAKAKSTGKIEALEALVTKLAREVSRLRRDFDKRNK